MFEKFSSTIKSYGNDIKNGAQNIQETTTLKHKASQIEKSIIEKYIKIGELYYSEHHETPSEEFSQFIQEIDSMKSELININKKLTTWKCPICGSTNLGDTIFCIKCGSKCSFSDNQSSDDKSVNSADSNSNKGTESQSEVPMPQPADDNTSEAPMSQPIADNNTTHDQKKCPECGTFTTINSVFCPTCGHRFL